MAKKSGAFELLIGLVFLGGFLYFVFELGTRETLICERDTGRPRCTAELDELLYSNITVYDDVIGVRVVVIRNRFYQVAVKVRSGREDEVISKISEEEARRAESWFANGEARVVIVREAHRKAVLIMLGVLGLGLLVISWLVVRRWRSARARRRESGVVIL